MDASVILHDLTSRPAEGVTDWLLHNRGETEDYDDERLTMETVRYVTTQLGKAQAYMHIGS